MGLESFKPFMSIDCETGFVARYYPYQTTTRPTHVGVLDLEDEAVVPGVREFLLNPPADCVVTRDLPLLFPLDDPDEEPAIALA